MKTTQLYPLFLECSSVDTDTRKIRKNSIFFALKGDNFNGNSYALEALKLGAKYAVVDEESYSNHPNIILVNDCLTALQQLANIHRKTLRTPIISLTGSNGKTTTKELINTVLSKRYKTVATIGNLNNHIGVPLTLLSMTESTEIGIVEMGANHLKEIELLCSIAEPNYGYITNFGKAHLEGFGSVEGVVKAKSELYDSLRKNNGIAFINTDDEKQVNQSKEIECVNFNGAEIIFLEANPFVKVQYKDTVITSQLIGKYNYNNIAVAIAIGAYFDITINLIKEGIENYIPSNNRSQIIEKDSNKIIMDAYNANPSSMTAALENFQQLDSDNKIALLGDMFELGNESAAEHQKIAEIATNSNFNEVYLIGKAFSTTNVKNAFIYDSFESFKNSKEKLAFSNATILIKGSRGMALERILDLF
ncbi:MAG: UDP-N-acetylmuramoyl-tripeptide--D-alanyl-D-alanine ligase [Lutibacter sp.]|nr:UDP-N-acetylmuramoyl-tripeptide--D-alanyl-D-alanine ligase [Lutibacter sp.]MBP9600511.1 UDP-N-acetylmuramoyl-tripeptide--D-alanyl-D-alanine ligase [Lutibacter sp.]